MLKLLSNEFQDKFIIVSRDAGINHFLKENVGEIL